MSGNGTIKLVSVVHSVYSQIRSQTQKPSAPSLPLLLIYCCVMTWGVAQGPPGSWRGTGLRVYFSLEVSYVVAVNISEGCSCPASQSNYTSRWSFMALQVDAACGQGAQLGLPTTQLHEWTAESERELLSASIPRDPGRPQTQPGCPRMYCHFPLAKQVAKFRPDSRREIRLSLDVRNGRRCREGRLWWQPSGGILVAAMPTSPSISFLPYHKTC